ncbi:zinc finger protein 271-like isoform X1 [Achroia grisella]|uniref:zinc finger protein 271-like isoform X1 n=2 Tax=Achroia grisella TaxID=688607 RepID=UPI0027D2ADE1|nr:zinc finger protein 271-like isoform X1 [Achroia grisella]
MNKICRICLEEGVLSSIFTKNFNLSLCDMIEYCCNTKIYKNDGLPEQMCSNCVYKLGIAYHFKQTCESADVRLRQYLGRQIPEKSSDAAVMTDPIVPTTVIKKCKCRLGQQRKTSTNYKRKPEAEKLKRGPKPKPKQTHNCYQCDKEFRCQAQLETHLRTHTGDKPFTCMYCPRRFTQKHNLTIHLRVHTGEKPFQCEVCSKRFSAQGNLHAHLKIHTGQRDHVCTLCNKSFITSSELTRHMSKHRGVKNFKCDLCNSAYIHSRDLKLHKMKKHDIDENSKVRNEGYNTNIDIIGIDVGKEVPPIPMPINPAKEVNHHIQQLINEKPQPILPEHNTLLPFDHRVIKDVYNSHHPYTNNKNIIESHNCAVCGEGFDYLAALAQHHLQYHKGYDTLQPKPYNNQ